MTYTRISADCHIDVPWLPPDLFTAHARAALRDRMPYVTDGPDGPYWTSKNGASFGLVGGVGPSGQKYVPGLHARADAMAATGLYADGRKGIRRPTDPHRRIADMERDGVQAEVIYGIPHGDGVWPESSKYIAEQFGYLPPAVTHKIVCENAGRFYGLIR